MEYYKRSRDFFSPGGDVSVAPYCSTLLVKHDYAIWLSWICCCVSHGPWFFGRHGCLFSDPQDDL